MGKGKKNKKQVASAPKTEASASTSGQPTLQQQRPRQQTPQQPPSQQPTPQQQPPQQLPSQQPIPQQQQPPWSRPQQQPFQQQPVWPRPQQQPPQQPPQQPLWSRPQQQPFQQQPVWPTPQQQPPQQPVQWQQPAQYPIPQQQQQQLLWSRPQQQPVWQPRPQQQSVPQPSPEQQPVQQPSPEQQRVQQPSPEQQPVQQPSPEQQPVQQPSPEQQPLKQPKLRKRSTKQPIISEVQAGPSIPISPMTSITTSRPETPSKAFLSGKDIELALQIPKRQDVNKAGTRGRKITVQTNMMTLVFNKNFQTTAVQYDVTFDPDKPKFLLRTVFEKFRQDHFPNRYPAFDGRKNVFSANDLPFGEEITGESEIYDKEREMNRKFTVSMKKTQEIDLSWLKFVKPGLEETERNQISIQAIDIILRHGPASFSIPVGRSLFYEPEDRPRSLTGGLDLWTGAFQSVILGWKPYLNVDVAHKGFPTPKNVIDVMRDICLSDRDGNRPLDSRDIQRNHDKIRKFLKGLKVCYQLPGEPSSRRTHRINDIVECPRNNQFEKSKGVKCSVEDYFRKEKRYNIRYSLLPCLWVGPTNKQIHVPAELCTIVAGQATQKKMSEEQTSIMIKYAATNTHERKQKIAKAFDALKLNQSKTMTNEFHLSVSGELETVPARVLSAPDLKYGETSVHVTKGVWRAEKFLNAVTLNDHAWTILSLDDRYIRDTDMHELSTKLIKAGIGLGMQLGKPFTPFNTFNTRQFAKIEGYLKDQKKYGLSLIIVIIPNLPEAYSQVKQISELNIGILTQCIKSRTMSKLSPATIGNILLKINAKLNGVNHTIAKEIKPKWMNRPFILIGADVTHPSPDARDIPSIAAVAASHDPEGFKYNIEIRLQAAKQEIIEDLKVIIRNQFIFFYKQNNCRRPERVIVYRDGVSEGQLVQVMRYELKAMKDAFLSLQSDGQYNPPITFLVVQKRHHVRLFPTDKRNSDDRNFNVQAGTIVDTHITHPSHIDFYLVSHASIQGTAKPTKYRCIWNDNKLTEDEIEELTYYLCHMFTRCTRSVSYPAPTYYAHLAAFRARALIYNKTIHMDNLRDEQKKIALKLDMKVAPMFFV